MNYIVAEAQTRYDLMVVVAEHLSNGYEPLGGVAVATNDAGAIHSYVQALVKRSEGQESAEQ